MKYNILLVDNDLQDLEVTKDVLSEEQDFIVTALSDPDEAIALIRQNIKSFAAVILDYRMPKDGLTTAQEMFAINPHLQIAILSADQSREVLKKSIEAGVSHFIDKGEDREVLIGIVRTLCQKWKSAFEVLDNEALSSESYKDNEVLIRSYGLVGRSEKLAEVCRMISRAANSDCNVLIRGESGSGKELIAQAIHNHSKRKSEPFVAINIAALNPNLAESELFGHVKGAFTGAVENNVGKFLSAHGGTLFLDEIGDLRLDLQVKLLRAIQEKKIQPVGSNKNISFDVRIITATHVDLERAIKKNDFREDLYYRLNVFPIFNPALRERPDDIQPLSAHFMKIHTTNKQKLLMKTVKLFERYKWPGNIRELENEIQRLLAFDYGTIEPEHLSHVILDSLEYKNGNATHFQMQRKLWKMELEYIEESIHQAGSMREACKTIFMAPASTIHTRITSLRNNLSKLARTKEVTNEII